MFPVRYGLNDFVLLSDLIHRSHAVAQTLVASPSTRRPGFFLLPVYVEHVEGEVG
jgi:hypothetical protein